MSEFSDLDYRLVDVPPVKVVRYSADCGPEQSDVARAMGTGFEALADYMQRHDIKPSAPPVALYTSFGPEGTDFQLYFPIATAPSGLPAEGQVDVADMPGCRAMRFTHRGPYSGLHVTYARIARFLMARGLMKDENNWSAYMPMWEEYAGDPAVTPEADLLTYIFLPVND